MRAMPVGTRARTEIGQLTLPQQSTIDDAIIDVAIVRSRRATAEYMLNLVFVRLLVLSSAAGSGAVVSFGRNRTMSTLLLSSNSRQQHQYGKTAYRPLFAPPSSLRGVRGNNAFALACLFWLVRSARARRGASGVSAGFSTSARSASDELDGTEREVERPSARASCAPPAALGLCCRLGKRERRRLAAVAAPDTNILCERGRHNCSRPPSLLPWPTP
jgi:hypothetical protein